MTGASEKLKIMHLNSTQEPLNESQRVSAAGTKIEEVVYKRPQTTQWDFHYYYFIIQVK